MSKLVLISVLLALGYMVYDVNAALTSKIDAVRGAYSHTSSMYEDVQDECADLNVMHCSREMLAILRAQR